MQMVPAGQAADFQQSHVPLSQDEPRAEGHSCKNCVGSQVPQLAAPCGHPQWPPAPHDHLAGGQSAFSPHSTHLPTEQIRDAHWELLVQVVALSVGIQAVHTPALQK